MGELVPRNPDDNPFVDNEKVRELTEKVIDILRPIGLTVLPDGVGFALHPEHGQMIMQITALVRPSAGQDELEDREAREQFNQMMADQNKAHVEKQADAIRAALGAEDFEAIFMGDEELESECSHERRHPDGFCLDCGEGMIDDDEAGS